MGIKKDLPLVSNPFPQDSAVRDKVRWMELGTKVQACHLCILHLYGKANKQTNKCKPSSHIAGVQHVVGFELIIWAPFCPHVENLSKATIQTVKATAFVKTARNKEVRNLVMVFQ